MRPFARNFLPLALAAFCLLGIILAPSAYHSLGFEAVSITHSIPTGTVILHATDIHMREQERDLARQSFVDLMQLGIGVICPSSTVFTGDFVTQVHHSPLFFLEHMEESEEEWNDYLEIREMYPECGNMLYEVGGNHDYYLRSQAIPINVTDGNGFKLLSSMSLPGPPWPFGTFAAVDIDYSSPAVVFTHHPPASFLTTDIVSGSVVLFGHLHATIAATHDGSLLLGTPSIAYNHQFRILVAQPEYLATSVVDVEAAAFVVSVVPPSADALAETIDWSLATPIELHVWSALTISNVTLGGLMLIQNESDASIFYLPSSIYPFSSNVEVIVSFNDSTYTTSIQYLTTQQEKLKPDIGKGLFFTVTQPYVFLIARSFVMLMIPFVVSGNVKVADHHFVVVIVLVLACFPISLVGRGANSEFAIYSGWQAFISGGNVRVMIAMMLHLILICGFIFPYSVLALEHRSIVLSSVCFIFGLIVNVSFGIFFVNGLGLVGLLSPPFLFGCILLICALAFRRKPSDKVELVNLLTEQSHIPELSTDVCSNNV